MRQLQLFGLVILVSWMVEISGNHFEPTLQGIKNIRARIANEKTLTYALKRDKELVDVGMSIIMAAVADAVTRASCLSFTQIPDPEKADIVVGKFPHQDYCYFEFRGIEYDHGRVTGICKDAKHWVLPGILKNHFAINPAFIYPTYSERGEVRLWFLEISDLNNQHKCPCKDASPDCVADPNACATDGYLIGKCIKTCGVCPYYDNHI